MACVCCRPPLPSGRYHVWWLVRSLLSFGPRELLCEPRPNICFFLAFWLQSTSPSSSSSSRDDDPTLCEKRQVLLPLEIPAFRRPAIPRLPSTKPAAELVLAIDGLRLGVNCPAGNTPVPAPPARDGAPAKTLDVEGAWSVRIRRQDTSEF